MMRLGRVSLLLICLLALVDSQECPDSEMLVTFHPHMDIFWLNSESQLRSIEFNPEGFLYAMNQRNSKTIYNSMFEALIKNSSRRYFTTEIFFFKDWYDYLNQTSKDRVKELVKSGQLEVANAGWVENDEAVTYYDDIIEQYTLGMNFMYTEFGHISRVAWATDCFGHSNSQAALVNELGFEMQGIERLDERYIHERNGGPLLEFYWKTKSDSNNRVYGGLFTHVRYFLHEVNNLRNIPVDSTINEFKMVTSAMESLYKKKVSFRFLGNDFEEFIDPEFTHLESVMAKLSENSSQCGGYHYGNPSEYMDKIKQYWKSHPITTRENDFMPDWDQDRYWTGYYTTDPQLKKKCRDSSRMLNFYKRAISHAYGIKSIPDFSSLIPIIRSGESIVSMMQHHDGITATSKHWIMLEMQNKMSQINTDILSSLKNVFKSTFLECNLLENHNECVISTTDSHFVLNLYHYGTPRNERIEVIFANKSIYRPTNLNKDSYDIFCSGSDYSECRVVMSVPLSSGTTQVDFVKEDKFDGVVLPVNEMEGSHKNVDWLREGRSFRYVTTGKHIDISYHQSSALASTHR